MIIPVFIISGALDLDIYLLLTGQTYRENAENFLAFRWVVVKCRSIPFVDR